MSGQITNVRVQRHNPSGSNWEWCVRATLLPVAGCEVQNRSTVMLPGDKPVAIVAIENQPSRTVPLNRDGTSDDWFFNQSASIGKPLTADVQCKFVTKNILASGGTPFSDVANPTCQNYVAPDTKPDRSN